MQSIRWFGAGLVAALAAATFPTPSRAAPPPVTVYYHSGAWQAFDGKNAQGQLICGMQTESSQAGRSVGIRRVIGGGGLDLTAAKPSWNIPAGTTIPIVLQIGSSTPYALQGSGDGNEVAFSLSADQAASFRGDFRQGVQLSLSFPSGNEPTWTVSLAGSDAVDHTFERCVQDLSAQAGVPVGGTPGQAAAAPTQPFGQPATQPFGSSNNPNAAAVPPLRPPTEEGSGSPATNPQASPPGGATAAAPEAPPEPVPAPAPPPLQQPQQNQ